MGKRVVEILVLGFVFMVLVFGVFGVFAQENNQGTGDSQGTSEDADSAQETDDGEEARTDDAEDLEGGEREAEEETRDGGTDDADDVEDVEGGEDAGGEEEAGDRDLDEISDEDVNRELVAGSKPGDTFHFVDKFLDNLFGNCLDIRKERAAEIRELAREGKIEEARQSLGGYQECAEEVEREVSPEEMKEAVRGARLIRKAIRDVEEDIPEGDRRELVDDIIDKEKNIEKAAEIASKVKELCVQLSKLDPGEYSRVCKTKDDAPRWQRELDDDLTEEQKDAARKFGRVMQECFRTEGRECKCNELEEINKPFADRCSIVAPLAAKCEDGDEGACEAMNEATEGIEELLPDYLQDVFAELEGDVKDDQFDMHMPRECREAGAKTPRDCMKVMVITHAPVDCEPALKEAIDRGVESERELRKICEEIMMPPECKGLTPQECGVKMFRDRAPRECIEEGLTGENRDDPRKCERLMREKFGEGPEGPDGRRGPGPGFGPDCRKIENPDERLKCYDGALEGIGPGGQGPAGFGGREGRGHFPQPCEEAQALTRESCEKIMREWGEKQRSENEERFGREREEREGEFRERGEDERRRFDEERRRREEEFRGREGEFRERGEEERRRAEEEFRRREGEFGPPPEGFRPPEGEFGQPPEGFRPPEGEQAPSGEEHTTTESGGTSGGESSGGSGGETSGTGGGESGGTTGSVISGNAFLDYYYGR